MMIDEQAGKVKKGEFIPTDEELYLLTTGMKYRPPYKYGEGIIWTQLIQTPGLTADELIVQLRSQIRASVLKNDERAWAYLNSWPQEKVAAALTRLLEERAIKSEVGTDGKKRYFPLSFRKSDE